MPLGFQRLNERQQRPNALINFIKPLQGPDEATAQEFLSRIAAQAFPVMKKHHITVMALEEHECNPEFLGRNFNAGEVIQLVLKDKQGRWLSMKFVQMVMMHELAHCKQMNHSRFFWNVRNDYAKQMEGLWGEGYMGEGIWGRGRGLEDGAFINAAPPDQNMIPKHLCGGSYRRRGRKRKRGKNGQEQPERLTYAERQQRRIARKFGKHGDGASLGDDELLRGALETMAGGQRHQGKPRVANSKRGRELRAAAALARLEQAKTKTPEQTPELEDDLGSETESEWEDDVTSRSGQDAVVISDGHGGDLVKVCGDGEDDEEGAGREMDELRLLSAESKRKFTRDGPTHGEEGCTESATEPEVEEGGNPLQSDALGRAKPLNTSQAASTMLGRPDDSNMASDCMNGASMQGSTQTENSGPHLPAAVAELLREIDASNAASLPDVEEPLPTETPVGVNSTLMSAPATSKMQICPMCSLENDPSSPTCVACSNVLRPTLMPNHWRCGSEDCKDSKYINAGDAGRCGVCGAQKPSTSAATAVNNGRPMGITRPDVLRWD